MKTCTGCGHDKPLEDYHRQSRNPDGRKARCKTCCNTYEADRRVKNRDEIRARDRAKYAKSSKVWHAWCTRCNWPDCQREHVLDGLCETHYNKVATSRESPLALTEGRWERGVGGVRRWVA